MKRKDFINYILKNVVGGEPTGSYAVYCDRSQSSNCLKRERLFFLRIKYPCFSSKIRINFVEYKNRINQYLHSIGEYQATVHLRTAHSGHSFEYNFIEIIFHNGKPWEKSKNQDLDYEFSSHPSRKNKTRCPKVNKPNLKENKNEVTIDKKKLADLIKLDIETNPTKYTRSCCMTDDKLIELFNLVTI